MNFLSSYWKKYKITFSSAIVCVAFEAICDLLGPQIMSKLIDHGVMKLDLNYVTYSGLLMLLIVGIGAIFATTRNFLSSRASQNFGADLRLDLFTKIQNLSIEDSDKFDGGSLITRMTNDVTQLVNFINGLMRIFFKAPLTFIGCIVLSGLLNIRTLPIILIIIIIALISMGLSMKLSYPMFYKVQNSIDHFNMIIREYLMGIRLVKAFGRYEHESKRFEDANQRLTAMTTKANRILSLFAPISSLAVNSGIVIILIMGVHWVNQGVMTLGEIIAFTVYMSQILMSLTMINNILNMFVRTKASYVRINEVMSITNNEQKNPATFINKTSNNITKIEHIAFNKVYFRYPLSTGDMALKDINFTVSKGQTLGIIGATGSGKSTLTSLLLKFYSPTTGDITFNDTTSINQIQSKLIHRLINIAPQTPTLFSGTIGDNIRWGNKNATDEQVMAVMSIAQALSIVDSSATGLQINLKQAGLNLSGGQKQRLSIARALIAKPDVLILDDCTSALDPITERAVLNGLTHDSNRNKHDEQNPIKKDLICILISQRVSSIMNADKILVLDNGSQIALGTHHQLLQTCQIYKEIVTSQLGIDYTANLKSSGHYEK